MVATFCLMGTGEQAMRTWGYTSGSFCVVLGLLSLTLAILLFVVAKSEVSDEFKNDAVGFAAVVLVVGVVAMILGSVTIWKVYLANQLYLKVSSDAAQGRIAIAVPASFTAPSLPLASTPPATATPTINTAVDHPAPTNPTAPTKPTKPTTAPPVQPASPNEDFFE